MGKFVALIIFAVSAYFVAFTEGKQYVDLKCHPGYIGEARVLEIENDCRQIDSSEAECFKMCVLKTLGIIERMNGDENSKSLYLAYRTVGDKISKLFSPEAQDVAKKLSSSMFSCGDFGVYTSEDLPCGSSSQIYSLSNCLEKILSC